MVGNRSRLSVEVVQSLDYQRSGRVDGVEQVMRRFYIALPVLVVEVDA